MLWPGAAAHLASVQGLGMAVLEWHLMGAHGLAATFTDDAGLLFLLSCLLKANAGHQAPP